MIDLISSTGTVGVAVMQVGTTVQPEVSTAKASESTGSLLANYGIDILLNVLVGWLFYLLGSRSTRKQQNELKAFISNLIPYEGRLNKALKSLEGKYVQGEGRIVVDRNDEGAPLRVRFAPTQVIQPGYVESQEEVYGPTIEIGPPPTPPQSVGIDLTARWTTESNQDEREEQDKRENQ
jgi:hypothetical protein